MYIIVQMGFTAVATASSSVGVAWSISNTDAYLVKMKFILQPFWHPQEAVLSCRRSVFQPRRDLSHGQLCAGHFRIPVCAIYKMATRTLRELDESPRMFRSVLQSPYNLKWLDYRVLGMRTRQL